MAKLSFTKFIERICQKCFFNIKKIEPNDYKIIYEKNRVTKKYAKCNKTRHICKFGKSHVLYHTRVLTI